MAVDRNNAVHYCKKCGKTKKVKEFYLSKNLEKYPLDGGCLDECKDCITMHVNNWDPETFKWILEECDVPFIQKEWDSIMLGYANKDPSKITGKSILGRYLSKMKLSQWMKYRWKDTEFLQKMADEQATRAMERQGMDAQEIAKEFIKQKEEQAQFANSMRMIQQANDGGGVVEGADGGITPTVVQPYVDQFASLDDDMTKDLTEDDIKYLRLKWGKMYKPDEWVQLEQLYVEMTESYDIQSAGDKNSLLMMCKASLKANQLMDIGDKLNQCSL